MNPSPVLYAKQFQLAQYYLVKLRGAERVYKRGGDHAVFGLTLAQRDWPQIQQWQAWAVTHAGSQREAAEMCSAYPHAAGDLLDILLTPSEHQKWREAALVEARRLGERRSEVAHLLALGEICLKLGEQTQTETYIHRALELGHDDPSSRAHALRILGYNAYFRNQFADAQTYHQQSLELYRSLNDQAGIARNLIGLVSIMERRGEYSDTMRAYAAESLSIFRRLGDHRGTAHALSALAKTLKNDDPEQAIMCLEEGLQLLHQFGNLTDIIELYIIMENALALMSQYHRAKTISEEALRIFRQQRIRHGEVTALRCLGSLELSAGKFPASRAYAEQSLAIARELDIRWDIGVNLMNLGTISTILDEYDRAEDELMMAEEVLRRIDAPIDVAYTLDLISFVHWSRGDAENMRACLREVFTILLVHSYPLAFTLAVTATAALRLLMGDSEKCVLLLGAVSAHPQTNPSVRKFGVGKIRRAAEQVLDAETITRLMEEGAKLDFEAEVAEIRAELKVGTG